MSNFQLIPLDRVRDFFNDQLGLPLSKGSISNFNDEVNKILEKIDFTNWAQKELLSSSVLHADESGINVGGKGHWLHSLSNGLVVLYHADKKRGKEAMDRMGILPEYKGILCHDHWKPYYSYDCIHSLCNAHHQRELEFAHKQNGQKWAKEMQELLEEIRQAVQESKTGFLSPESAARYRVKYHKILESGKNECPLLPVAKKKQGREKKSKSRNLLERLLDYEEDTLRFMGHPEVPYTNNIAEGDVRVAKLYQNVSKCFRTLTGAKNFCLRRSYIITARRHGMDASEALICLFRGEIPFFMRE